jgi:hypothetical protein
MRRITSVFLCLYFVSAPVGNIRHDPSELKKSAFEKNDWYQTTQVLRGDRLKIIGEEQKGFVPVRVLDQKIYVNGKKTYISGWINKKHITRKFVPRLRMRKTNDIRRSVIRLAETFLGKPYLLGGRSFSHVDCSGLVGLCYQMYGVRLCRNTVSQYIDCKKIRFNPKQGDLIFYSALGTWKTISHVFLYVGNDIIIEARGRDVRKVVRTTGKERFGESVWKLKSGGLVEKMGRGSRIYFGSVFP